jgi:hypothetical protein
MAHVERGELEFVEITSIIEGPDYRENFWSGSPAPPQLGSSYHNHGRVLRLSGSGIG